MSAKGHGDLMGGEMVLYVRELDQTEKRRLQEWLAAADPERARRARVVLMSAEGYRIPEIGEVLGAHPANLRKWIHRFNERGISGLRTVHSGGAKPRISSEQKARIVDLAQCNPRDLGLRYSTWTLQKLADQACQRHIVERISHERVRQILREAGCSYRSTIA